MGGPAQASPAVRATYRRAADDAHRRPHARLARRLLPRAATWRSSPRSARAAPELARKFFDWYSAVFAEGALTAREKSLIALGGRARRAVPVLHRRVQQGRAREGLRPGADDRGGARGGGDPRRRVAGARRADAQPRATSWGCEWSRAQRTISEQPILRARPAARRSPSRRPRGAALALERAAARDVRRARSRRRACVRCARRGIDILQINVGKLLQPDLPPLPRRRRARPHARSMSRDDVPSRASRVLGATDIPTVDITGGAPELHPDFRWLVDASARRSAAHVMDRCNLTVLLLPRTTRPARRSSPSTGSRWSCSLPHYRRARDRRAARRGRVRASPSRRCGGSTRSATARGSGLRLVLVTNPVGAFLPAAQAALEARVEARAAAPPRRRASTRCTRSPTCRSAASSSCSSERATSTRYMERLVDAFNPRRRGRRDVPQHALGRLGRPLYDCDFNQMLELRPSTGARRSTIRDFDPAALAARAIVSGQHCYGCTAGAAQLVRRRGCLRSCCRTAGAGGSWASWSRSSPARSSSVGAARPRALHAGGDAADDGGGAAPPPLDRARLRRDVRPRRVDRAARDPVHVHRRGAVRTGARVAAQLDGRDDRRDRQLPARAHAGPTACSPMRSGAACRTCTRS